MPVREQLATDQTDPWQVVPRQVFTPSVVVCRVRCLRVTGDDIITSP